MAVAAYSTTVKIPGTSTAMVGEGCSGSASAYQITNTAKRVLDPTVAVTVKANGVTQAPSTYTLDPLFGKLAFTGTPTAPITIDGSYLPMLSVALAKDYSISGSAEMVDTTTFDSAGVKSRMPTLKDFSGTLTTLNSMFYDNDPGAGTQLFATIFDGATPVLIEIRPGGAGDYFRGWALLAKQDPKVAVAGVIDFPISFTGAARAIAGETEGVSFGWGQ